MFVKGAAGEITLKEVQEWELLIQFPSFFFSSLISKLTKTFSCKMPCWYLTGLCKFGCSGACHTHECNSENLLRSIANSEMFLIGNLMKEASNPAEGICKYIILPQDLTKICLISKFSGSNGNPVKLRLLTCYTLWWHWLKVMTTLCHYITQCRLNIKVFGGIYMRASSQEVLVNLIGNMCLEITLLKLPPVAIPL